MRPEKHGTKRTQLSVGTLEEAIAEDAFVRRPDLFADRLGDLTRWGRLIALWRKAERWHSLSILTINGLMKALKKWLLNLDGVENTLFFLFSCGEPLWRFMVPEQQNFGCRAIVDRWLSGAMTFGGRGFCTDWRYRQVKQKISSVQ